MFQSLTEKFERVFAGIRARGKLSESDVRDTAKEVRRALLEADVNFRVVKDFVARIETHGSLLEPARKDAQLILSRDPNLTSPRGEALRHLLYLFERDEAIRLLRAG
jgi:signal recognition particle GTPase